MASVFRAEKRIRGERLLPIACPTCRDAKPLNPRTSTTTTLLLPHGQHPRCLACDVLMGPGHVEDVGAAARCSWCQSQNCGPAR